MIFILLIYFICLYYSFPKKSISRIIILLYIGSLSANFFIGTDLITTEYSDFFYVLWTAFVISLLIIPWRKYSVIDNFKYIDEKFLTRFVFIIGGICIFMTLGCGLIAYMVSQVVENIDVFKYKGGQEQVYEDLGVSMKPYLLAYILYPISYLFIPLIFYYLSKRKIKYAIWCLLSSLTSVAFGFAYFSRAHTIHYILLVLILYLFLNNALSPNIRKKVQRISIVLVAICFTSFIIITSSRFDGKTYANQNNNAIIKNTMLYSMADYFGLWWYAGEDVFNNYNLEGFDGKIALQGINRSLNMLSFGYIPTYSKELAKERERLLKEHSGSFIGVASYFLYDTGLILSTIILIAYAIIVEKRTPKNKKISIDDLFLFTILIQLPLFGIFYSTLDTVLLLLIYWVIIRYAFSYISKIKLKK